MGVIYFKENYDAILEAFNNRPFYIFGNSIYAQMFYLYCKESGVDRNIKGFILSDIRRLKNNRKEQLLHGCPIRDIHWLKQMEQQCEIFLGAREKTIHGQLLPILDNEIDADLYYVSDFVNSIMYHHYMSYAYEKIITHYKFFSNPHEMVTLNVSSSKKGNIYNYTPRVSLGILPDVHIFGENEDIDEIYCRQLQYYSYIDSNLKNEREKKEYQCRIYLARSHFDKELKEEFHTPFTESIQVGADLTDIEIVELKDNGGENLSARNQDYCEMSAVYWAWKNDRDSDYIGLCHYRRRFVIDVDRMNYIMTEKYDAVYVVPQLIDGGLREEFVERNYYLTPEIWKLTTDAIERLSPEYLETWQQLETSYFLLPCNMFIMRREIFEDYCSWVFVVLEEVDRFYMTQGIQRNDRYLGYLAELLNTVFAMKHKESMKKGYVYMKILESE